MTAAQPSLFDQPLACAHNGTETSRNAARHATESGQVQRQEREILRCLRISRDYAENCWRVGKTCVCDGMTRKEIWQALGRSIPESRVGARVNRLIKNGLCREEGTRVPAGGTVAQKVVFVTAEGLNALEAGR